MHVPDGFLSPDVAAACAVPAVAAVGYGLHRANRELDERRVPMLGVHVLIGFGEAVITVAAVSAVLTARPDVVRVPA